MASVGCKPFQAVLTDDQLTEVVAAPGERFALAVYHLTVSNKGEDEATVSVFAGDADPGDGAEDRLTYTLAPSGGGDETDFRMPWVLPENQPLNSQQDVNPGDAYVTAFVRKVPASR
jgi:hypothetical protein